MFKVSSKTVCAGYYRVTVGFSRFVIVRDSSRDWVLQSVGGNNQSTIGVYTTKRAAMTTARHIGYRRFDALVHGTAQAINDVQGGQDANQVLASLEEDYLRPAMEDFGLARIIHPREADFAAGYFSALIPGGLFSLAKE